MRFPNRPSAAFLFLLLLSTSVHLLAQTEPATQQTPPAIDNPAPKPPKDISKRLGFLVGFEGRGGWSLRPASGASAYGGMKIGADVFALDLGYDRVAGHNGFATELSGMFSLFRFPGPQKDEKRNYLRMYAEPGLGFHTGGFTAMYPSAKAMLVLFSDHRLTTTDIKWSPYVELQRRFFLRKNEPGDFRITVGIIWAICEHCGLD